MTQHSLTLDVIATSLAIASADLNYSRYPREGNLKRQKGDWREKPPKSGTGRNWNEKSDSSTPKSQISRVRDGLAAGTRLNGE